MALLNHGNESSTRIRAKASASKLRITDSLKNWVISKERFDPDAFRKPISRALVADLAVERFIKLMEAMTRIKNAIRAKI